MIFFVKHTTGRSSVVADMTRLYFQVVVGPLEDNGNRNMILKDLPSHAFVEK